MADKIVQWAIDYVGAFPVKTEFTTLTADDSSKKLKPGWKSWYCGECGEGYVYRGKKPKHKCKGVQVMYSIADTLLGLKPHRFLVKQQQVQ